MQRITAINHGDDHCLLAGRAALHCSMVACSVCVRALMREGYLAHASVAESNALLAAAHSGGE